MKRTHARTQTPWVFVGLITAGVLGTVSTAHAQQQFVVSRTSSITYTPLSAAATLLSDDSDDDEYTITSPFPIRFYDATFTTLRVGDNGMIQFPASGQSISAGNSTPGSSGSPNNWIAPLWDDLRIFTNGSLSWEVAGTAPNRTLSVQWLNVSGCCTQDNLNVTFKVVFYEGPGMRIDVEYGSLSQDSRSFSATMAMEDNNGGRVIDFNPAMCGSSCDNDEVPTMSNTRVTVRPAPPPELTGAFVGAPRGGLPGETVTATVTLANLGTNTATSVRSEIWVSADNMFDTTADLRVWSTVRDQAFGEVTATATVTVPAVPPGDYFVFLVTDATGDWNEPIESNNVILSPQRFATAPDLTVSSVAVTNATGINPGEDVNFEVTVVNGGAPFSGMATVDLHVSSDTTFTAATDPLVVTTTVMFDGSLEATATATGRLPAVAPGQYYAIAVVDSANAVTEFDDTNNDSASADTFDSGPDFAIGALTVPTGVAPGASGAFSVRVDNLAVAFAGAVEYRLYASLDDTLDTMMDTMLGTYSVAFSRDAQVTDTQNVMLPTSLAAGRYTIFAVVDPNTTIDEADETNNEFASTERVVNAVDFTVASVRVNPRVVEVGVSATITAEFFNTGLPFTGNVPMGVFLSQDAIFDPGDQAVFRGFVFFPGGNQTGVQTYTFPVQALPGEAQFPPGAYNVFLAVDSTAAYVEADEMNNSAAASSTLRINGADLLVTDMTTLSPAFIGGNLEITMEVENDDVADARGFRYAYYLSDNRIIRVNDQQIFLSGTATIAAGMRQTFNDTVAVPTLTSTASLFVGVILDIFSQVPERTEVNNTRTSDIILADGTDIGTAPVEFLLPIPDLRAQIIQTPTVAAAGEDIAITRLITNDGVAGASDATYTYYLSTNPTISPVDDIPIFSGTVSLMQGQDDYGIDIITLGPDITAANYYVGIIVDPSDEIDEILEDNNAFTGPLIPVFPTTIQFTTGDLPDGVVGVPYEVGVYATGAPLDLTFTISEGVLPQGVEIDDETGILAGTPTEEGVFEFTARASAGTAFAEKQFVLRITSPTVEIRVATESLPTAFIGRPYSVQLVAVGGQLPYVWSTASQLPNGLSLSEDGIISGTPETPGGVPLTVQVLGSLGTQDTRQLTLNVISGNQAIQIQQNLLFAGSVNVPYCDPSVVTFQAENGSGDLTWSIIGDAPPGMAMSTAGDFCGTPTQAGRFPFTVRVQDESGLFDTSLFVFVVDNGTDLAISTFSLPVGDQNEAYIDPTAEGSTGFALSAIRGTEPYTWALIDGAGELPTGVTLSEDGILSGTPAESGLFAFLVQVTDAQLRTDTQPLSMQIDAPPEPIRNDDSGCSCSASKENNMNTPWTSLAILGVIGAFVLRRRRSFWRTLGVFAIACAASGTAQAQVITGTPFIEQRTTGITYTTLANCTTLTTNTDDGQYNVTIPFPFKYYDTNETDVRISANGAMTFSSSSISFSNSSLGTGTPNALIAPWWDDLWVSPSNTSEICHATDGSSPQRRFTVEWKNVADLGATTGVFSMKVILHEGAAGRIDIEYSGVQGTGAYAATSGMEDQAGGRIIPFPSTGNCGTSCSQTTLNGLANTRITYLQDAGVEVFPTNITTPEFAFLGAQTQVPVTVASLHSNPIGPFRVSVEASTSEMFTDPVVIGTSEPVTIGGFQVATVNVISTPPQSFGRTTMYMRGIVDSANEVMETDENNNVVEGTMPIRLLDGAPDLAVQRVIPDGASVNAGDPLVVTTTIQNVGGEPANNANIRLVLSGNPVISRQDVQLGDYTVSLAGGETVTSSVVVTVPAGTNSGVYYIGALADPDNMIVELSEANNGVAAFNTTTVTGASLSITTAQLPRAYLRVPYVALVEAVGAGSDAVWSVSEGELPSGLGLVAASGEIFGRPIMVETQTFTVQVESNGNVATQELTLAVTDPDVPLTIATRTLNDAIVGQEYEFQLLAAGGADTGMLTWSATGLPPGMSITEDGVILGTPTTPSTSVVTVTVANGIETATRDMQLVVRANSNLLIVPAALADARFGETYTAQLSAEGGTAPYTWILANGSLPIGITLSTEGELSGVPLEVGRFQFRVEARDSGNGSLTSRDENGFELIVLDATGFEITTPALDSGILGVGYDQSIAAVGGQPPYDWKLVEGRIPEGLIGEVDPNTGEYRIRGEPAEIGVTNLLISVEDFQGRTAQRAFALQVLETDPTPPPVEEDDGCTCVKRRDTTPLGFVALGLLGLVLLRRRRR